MERLSALNKHFESEETAEKKKDSLTVVDNRTGKYTFKS